MPRLRLSLSHSLSHVLPSQPVRAKHCFECRKCCPKFDHHCFWIGTCVGERNHNIFWTYLLLQSLESWWALSIAWSAWRKSTKLGMSAQTKDWLHLNMFVIPINLMLIIFVCFPIGLLAYHTYLAVAGLTTWEVVSFLVFWTRYIDWCQLL